MKLKLQLVRSALLQLVRSTSTRQSFKGILRSGKSCRLRWMNYLKPGIKRGDFTAEEALTIITLRRQLGNKLPGRTDNEIKNHWHTTLKNFQETQTTSNSSSSTTTTIEASYDHDQNNPHEVYDDLSSLPSSSRESNSLDCCNNNNIVTAPLSNYRAAASDEIYNKNQTIEIENCINIGNSYSSETLFGEYQSFWEHPLLFPMETSLYTDPADFMVSTSDRWEFQRSLSQDQATYCGSKEGIRFVWDDPKYQAMSTLREIMDGIHTQVSEIEDDLKRYAAFGRERLFSKEFQDLVPSWSSRNNFIWKYMATNDMSEASTKYPTLQRHHWLQQVHELGRP
ncbi:hypothetical protein Ddye_019435 [Dipteronia dyeriana]|uniref:HTH myb-type domain-containing protein n=1 Tax=Dipteronia dyeriana TaxID=168575 RepID=A0AAD9TXX6_9ROSI|nr:hypothetical protein Ddye_019435 [Dipteronia dyeriana]